MRNRKLHSYPCVCANGAPHPTGRRSPTEATRSSSPSGTSRQPSRQSNLRPRPKAPPRSGNGATISFPGNYGERKTHVIMDPLPLPTLADPALGYTTGRERLLEPSAACTQHMPHLLLYLSAARRRYAARRRAPIRHARSAQARGRVEADLQGQRDRRRRERAQRTVRHKPPFFSLSDYRSNAHDLTQRGIRLGPDEQLIRRRRA